jgi:outer membrane protein OmpA-like peptidoglycan-associated protein
LIHLKQLLEPESHDKLEEIVKVMNKYSNAKFSLEGYTDSTGIAVKNLQLSKDRAAAVKLFSSKGISADRLRLKDTVLLSLLHQTKQCW